MHGVKRDDGSVPVSAEERQVKADKIAKYNAAKTQCLAMRRAHQLDGAAYAITTKLIEINPDFYTLFNYRKEIVIDMIGKQPDAKAALSTAELALSFKALLKNPKCYGAWHHRIWVMDLGATDVQAELHLCDKMLMADARNFHCWNYRRAVAARARTPPEQEFEYTTVKINENFSNYSAWHYRTVLIPRIYDAAWMQSGPGPQERRKEYDTFLDSEFELVKQAFYTEPEDQSAWLYHRWLLGRVVATGAANALPVLGISLGTHLFEEKSGAGVDEGTKALEGASSASSDVAASLPLPSASASLARHSGVFAREHASISELLEIEPNCKWALLTSAILAAGIIACRQQQQAQAGQDESAEIQQRIDEIEQTFDRLQALDPMRTNYYRQVRQGFLKGNAA